MTAPEPPADVVTRLRAAGCVFAEEEATLLVEAATSVSGSAREKHRAGEKRAAGNQHLDLDKLEALIAQRVAGLPLEHLLGWAEFAGLRIAVGPGVFVPRRRTEFLAERAILAAQTAHPVVVDLCCGTGAVAAAIGAALPASELIASDIDPDATAYARQNLADRGTVFTGDLFAPLPPTLLGRVDILVANAPYVPTDDIATMPSEARDHEHRVALDGGADGLDLQRRIIAESRRWLAAGSTVLIETSAHQAATTVRLLREGGFDAHSVHSDEREATVAVGTLP
ncbi:putative protein N(5)-glutamine methyltransferase [Lacisediminihabitans changchengi]|uniref:Methyltransferase domain-containing protein n=1 Tax=Lacisediminihabitans changchengi TaxID=2787634 RepID=A0A934SM36_9MICO|nr:putative protein N(5)-glutamine methyltransferase [Lacisediminihabitans changchengi]MBK4347472.1 putative protein N(5)-glutamine methyltransferase [Lacisediminihabitans changchengi]